MNNHYELYSRDNIYREFYNKYTGYVFFYSSGDVRNFDSFIEKYFFNLIDKMKYGTYIRNFDKMVSISGLEYLNSPLTYVLNTYGTDQIHYNNYFSYNYYNDYMRYAPLKETTINQQNNLLLLL
jgi:hypothetical protein